MQLVTEVYCNSCAVYGLVTTSRVRKFKEHEIIFLGFALTFLLYSKPLTLARVIQSIFFVKVSVLFHQTKPSRPLCFC